MNAFTRVAGLSLATLVATTVAFGPSVAHAAPSVISSADFEDATPDDPTVVVSRDNEKADPNEVSGLPDASSWIDGETVIDAPDSLGEHCDHRTDYSLQNLKNSAKVDYRDSATNNLDVPAKYELKAEKSTEFSWHMSVKLGTSADALIFGKVSAEINGGIAHEKKTRYGSKISTTVKPRKTVNGDRGMLQELTGYTQTTTYTNCKKKVVKGKFNAPYRENWKLAYA